MLNAMIVDDEAPARSELRYLLEETRRTNSIVEAASAREAVERLMEQRADVLFLDISMPKTSGMQLAEALRKLKNPPAVVFVTAYSEYALEAFGVDAVDYLRKVLGVVLEVEAVFLDYHHTSGILDQSHDRPRSHTLSAAGLSHDSHDLSGTHLKTDILCRAYFPLLREEAGIQMPDFKRFSAHIRLPYPVCRMFLSLLVRIQYIPKSVAEEVECKHDQHDRDARYQTQPGRIVQKLPPGIDHQSPGGAGFLNPQAQKAQAALRQNRRRNI